MVACVSVSRVPPSVLSAVATAMIAVLWAYEGWQYATFSAGEVQDAQRVFPRGIVLGTGGLILVYLFANVAYVAALGPDRAAATADASRFRWRVMALSE